MFERNPHLLPCTWYCTGTNDSSLVGKKSDLWTGSRAIEIESGPQDLAWKDQMTFQQTPWFPQSDTRASLAHFHEHDSPRRSRIPCIE
jgi:hypothetical protein